MSYAIEILDNERLLMNRYKRDLSGMGYGIIYFDPSIQNSYTRIKDGTKEKLIGSWIVNPRGTPDCTWTRCHRPGYPWPPAGRTRRCHAASCRNTSGFRSRRS